MAQPGGYSNNSPSMPVQNMTPGPGGPIGHSHVANGQPPLWGKPPFSTMKPPKQPFNQQYPNQQYPNTVNAVSSNGTPSRQNFSSPGSLSSQSSRDPSPIPSNCSDSMTHSRENLNNPNTAMISRHSPQQRAYQGMVAGSHIKISGDQQRSAFGGESGLGSLTSQQQFRPQPINDPSSNNQAFQGQITSGNTVSSNVSGRTMSPRNIQSQFLQDTPPHPYMSSVQMQKSNQFPTESGDSASQNRKFPSMPVSNVSNTFQMHSQPIVASHSLNGPPNLNTSSAAISKLSGVNSQARTTDSHGVSPSHLKGEPLQGQDSIFVKSQVVSPDGCKPTMPTNIQYSVPGGNSAMKPHIQQPSHNSMAVPQQNLLGPSSNVPGPNMPMQHPQMNMGSQVHQSQSQFLTSQVNPLSVRKDNSINRGQPHLQRPGVIPHHTIKGEPPKSTVSTPLNQLPVNQTMQQPSMPPPMHPPLLQPPPTSMSTSYSAQSSQPHLYSDSSVNLPSNQSQGPPVVSSSAGGEQMLRPGLQSNNQGLMYSPMPNQVSQYSPTSNSGYQPGLPPVSNPYQSGPAQFDGQHLPKRYPQQQGYPLSTMSGDGLVPQMANMSVTQQGFNKLWGLEYYDLLQTRNILPPEKVEPPKVKLHQEFLDNVNCSPEIFRCTLTKVPESNSLLQKARLPLGILIHPFKDLNHLPVIQCSTIVRCRVCRTYIHPFVFFVDHKRWKCNLCFRVNELPEEFQYDPVSKTYGDPTRRPEVKSSTIEFIAPSEYMLRPPQPAVYLFLLDVSQLAVECGYLQIFCDILLDELDRLPGDGRTQIGFITFDSTVHFYNLAEGLSQPQQMIVVDTDDIFLPCPDNLLVNLAESRELVRDLLQQLPQKFEVSYDNRSALGPALQAAYKLMAPTGGRVTVFQSCLPTVGPGSLTPREDPSQRASKEAPHLNPATDFYKCLALDCSGQQVAVDIFLVNSQYCDLATISGISRFSGGCVHHFPLFKSSNIIQAENFERVLRRYMSRKIGFEAVMRIRCSRGLAIHTFHGNFFVRSTDLLSLPNINPDAGFGMQVSIEESLSDLQNVCFQAALLYTTSKGERRIRVHTLCLPVATTLPDILHAADQQCIVGLLAKMAVDRSHQSSLSDARDAFINVAIDVLSAYRLVQSTGPTGGLLAPHNLRLLPLYILALLKYVAFRTGQSTRLDDRLFAMCQMKTLPLGSLIQTIYPDLYPVHCLEDQLVMLDDGSTVPQPPRLHLSAEKLEQRGAFLLDSGDHLMIYVGHNVAPVFCTDILGVSAFNHIPDQMYELPVLENEKSENIRNFINHLQSERSYCATLEVIRDDSPRRAKFTERLLEDRTESALSYYEFLQHLKANVK